MKYIKLFENNIQNPLPLLHGVSVVERLGKIIKNASKLDFNNEDIFNDIIFNIQSELGVTDGGFAGIHFSGEEYKQAKTEVEKIDILLEYIKGEIMDVMH